MLLPDGDSDPVGTSHHGTDADCHSDPAPAGHSSAGHSSAPSAHHSASASDDSHPAGGMSLKRAAAFTVAGLLVGIVAGVFSLQPAPPAIQPARVETREVEKKVEVKVRFTPASCLVAIDLANQTWSVVAKYEEAIGGQDRVIKDAYTGIIQRDSKLLNEAAAEQRRLKGESLSSLLELNNLRDKLDAANRACQADRR